MNGKASREGQPSSRQRVIYFCQSRKESPKKKQQPERPRSTGDRGWRWGRVQGRVSLHILSFQCQF